MQLHPNQLNALRRTVIKPQVSVIKPKLPQPRSTVSQPKTLIRSTVRNLPPFPVKQAEKQAVKQSVPVVYPKQLRNVLKSTPSSKPKNVQQVSINQTELTKSQLDVIKSLKNVGVGQYFAVLGNGPSLLKIDTSVLKSIPKLNLCTINVPDKRCWPTPYWAFFDRSQYHRHKELYKTYSGTIFNSTAIREENPHSVKFKHSPGLGFSLDLLKGLYVGMSSVYAVIQIATYMNFEKIFVLGCDMNNQVDSNQTHFYGVNQDVKPDIRKMRFEKEANWYNHMANNVSDDIKSKVVFCSKGVNPWPFMDNFQSVAPDEAVNFIHGVIVNAS